MLSPPWDIKDFFGQLIWWHRREETSKIEKARPDKLTSLGGRLKC